MLSFIRHVCYDRLGLIRDVAKNIHDHYMTLMIHSILEVIGYSYRSRLILFEVITMTDSENIYQVVCDIRDCTNTANKYIRYKLDNSYIFPSYSCYCYKHFEERYGFWLDFRIEM